MSDIQKEFGEAQNKLFKLEVEINAVKSDTFFYEKNNDLDKLAELSNKKNELIKEYNAQKEIVDELKSKLDSSKPKIVKPLNNSNNFISEQKDIIKDKNEVIKEKNVQEPVEKNPFQKKKEQPKKVTKNQNYDTSDKKVCPKCKAFVSKDVRFCPECGFEIIKKPKSDYVDLSKKINIPTPKNDSDSGLFTRYLLKKKKNDGNYRFSISKILGVIYGTYMFLNVFLRYPTFGSLITGFFTAVIGYLIFFISGYFVRWGYNLWKK